MNAKRFSTTLRSRAAFTGGWRIGIVLSCLALAATVSPAQDQRHTPSTVTFTTLVNFDGTNGVGPGNLMQGPDGNIYGTTGGARGNGTFFKMTPGGSLTESVRYTGSTPGFHSWARTATFMAPAGAELLPPARSSGSLLMAH